MDRKLLVELRGKRGLSFAEIRQITGRAKSSIGYFCKKYDIEPYDRSHIISLMAANSSSASKIYTNQWKKKKAIIIKEKVYIEVYLL